MKIVTWAIERITGYKPITTYYEDFSIADNFGLKEIENTFNRCFKQAKQLGVEYLTEFVMAVNWKSFEWHDRGDSAKCQLYCDLYIKADSYAMDNLKGDALTYYIQTTD